MEYVNSVQAAGIQQYIWGEIAPWDNSTAPTHEDTDGKGGYQCVPTITARNAISSRLREKGMGVFVQSEEAEYTLSDDLVTWIVAPEAVDENNLYTYTMWGKNGDYEKYEQHKWEDGRLDTWIVSNKIATNSDSGPICDIGTHPMITFKTPYIRTPTIEISGYDAATGPCWATCIHLSATRIQMVTVSDSYGQAYGYALATGRWK